MHIFTRPEIEAHDDMARLMAFHDRLVNMRLLTLLHPKTAKEPLRLAFDNQVVITPLGDPVSIQYSDWQLLDPKEKSFPWIDLPDLIGCPVTGIGYVRFSDWKNPAPCLQFINQVHLVCESPHGGCALRHDRPREDAWDVLPVLSKLNS